MTKDLKQCAVTRLGDERGATLLIALMITLLVFALGSALATQMLAEITTSANYRNRGASLWQADSGRERAAFDFLADATWARDMVDYSTLPLVLEAPFLTSVVINGITVNFVDDGAGGVLAQYSDLGTTVTLDDGSFMREMMPPMSLAPANGSGNKTLLTLPVNATGSSGAVEPSTATVTSDIRVVVRRMTVWDNAIFGGAGQAGNTMNGNVQVRGSIHIVGDPTTDTDQGGTAFVLNHYRGAGDNDNFGADAWKLPLVPKVMFKGELVESLDAEIRVQNGDIDLSGNVPWGELDVPGDGYKEELDGFYSDANLDLSGSAAVHHTDYGGYDATGMPFPSLDDPYYDASSFTMYASHRQYLDAVSYTIPVSEISENTPAFNYDDGNGAQWNPATGTLDIEGLIRIAGNLDIATKQEGVEYRGEGTIYAAGDIQIHGDLMPTGDYLDTTDPNMNNLGLIADDDMNIASGPGESWIKVMAALYANDKTTVAKQTRIAGAIVANYFDLGINVPRVFQAPGLANNLPPGMPGSDPMLFVTGADVTNWYQLR